MTMGEENSTFDPDFLFSNFDSAQNTAPKEQKTKQEPNIEEQNKYIKELEEQNAKLKSVIKRLVGPQLFNSTESSNSEKIDLLEKLEEEIQSNPFAVILYLNNDISNVHRKEIDDVMRNISEKKSTQDVLMAHKLKAQNSAVPLNSFAANFKGKRTNVSKVSSDDAYVICACQYYKSFIVDRMGAPLLDSNPDVTEIWDLPVYKQTFMKALPIVEEPLNIRVKQLKQCFNCGGEHHLPDCTEPKDRDRINRNRQEFSKNQASSFNPKFGGDEPEERFKHFKPGQISVVLEEALGVSLKNQLPAYIYKLREMGYPPAWLKPVEESLKMYGAEGNALADPGAEEGEIVPVKLHDVVMYPGFNAPLPEGVEDEAAKIGMPPFHPDIIEMEVGHKRALLLGHVEEPLAKRLKFEAEEGECDMDVADEEVNVKKPPLPLIEVTEKQPPLPVEKYDNSTYRNWYHPEPLTAGKGVMFVMYTSPPVCRGEVLFEDLPKHPVTDIDREPWKNPLTSWWDPLYGDMAAPTGTFDNIRTLLSSTKRKKRKPML